MTLLLPLVQVSVALALGRLGWALLRRFVFERAKGPSAPTASRWAHAVFAAALFTPALLALPIRLPSPAAASPIEAASDGASGTAVTGFALLGGWNASALTPELQRGLVVLAAALLLPFTLIAALRFARQWLWLRALVRGARRRRRIGRVELVLSREIATPFSTIALGRAQVFLPEVLLRRPRDLRLALRHELHHHRRRDLHRALAVDALTVLFAWNPAMHSWARELSDWQERACDAELVSRGTPLRDYAVCLLRVAEDGLHSPLPAASAAMARPSGRSALKRRIEMLLDAHHRNGRLGLRGALLLAALATLVPLGAWAAAQALPEPAVRVPVEVAVALEAPAEPVRAEAVAEITDPQRSALPVGSRAPDLLLADGSGDEVRLSDLRGRVVVLHFWANWCRFCNEGVPALRAIEEELGDRVALAGVSVDESEEAFESFLRKHDVTWPQHRSEAGWKGQVPKAFGVRALPLHVVIDREGRIAASGVVLAQLRPTIEALVQGSEEVGQAY